jgi:hypothetical protein
MERAEIACASANDAQPACMAPRYYTSEEMRELLRCSEAQLRTLRRREGLPHFSLGKGFLYPIAETETWQAERIIRLQPPRARRSDAGVTVRLQPRRRSGAQPTSASTSARLRRQVYSA